VECVIHAAPPSRAETNYDREAFTRMASDDGNPFTVGAIQPSADIEDDTIRAEREPVRNETTSQLPSTPTC
jgi:hypothetical protein